MRIIQKESDHYVKEKWQKALISPYDVDDGD